MRQNVLSVEDVKKKSLELKKKQRDSVSRELDLKRSSARELKKRKDYVSNV